MHHNGCPYALARERRREAKDCATSTRSPLSSIASIIVSGTRAILRSHRRTADPSRQRRGPRSRSSGSAGGSIKRCPRAVDQHERRQASLLHSINWPYCFSSLIREPMFWGMESWDQWGAEIQERLAELTSEHSSPKHARAQVGSTRRGRAEPSVRFGPCLRSLASVVAEGNG